MGSGWVMGVPGLSFQRRLQTFIPMASYFVIPAQAGIQVFYLQAFTMALCPLFELGYGSEILKNWAPAFPPHQIASDLSRTPVAGVTRLGICRWD